MDEAYIMPQWKERGWVWTSKEELLLVLEILYKNEIVQYCIKATANGFFVIKLY